MDHLIPLTNDVSFDSTLLIYPRGIEGCQGRKKKFAVGPDGLSVRDVNNICTRIKCKLFSLFLWLHWIPDILLHSITIFIPKKNKTNIPASLRPLSISSNLTRLFHKALVSRTCPLFTPDSFQFGFRPLDGVARGIDILDAVMSSCMKELRPFAIAILDLEKAFDNVRHPFIVRCLDELQIPVGIIEYLKILYSRSRKNLSFKGNPSKTIHPEQRCGKETVYLPRCSSLCLIKC